MPFLLWVLSGDVRYSSNFNMSVSIYNTESSIFNLLCVIHKLKYYSVEVIIFDGESYTEEVEVRNADEAQ